MFMKDLTKRIKGMLNQTEHFKNVFGKMPQNGADVIANSMKLLSGRTLKELPEVYEEILKITPFKVK